MADVAIENREQLKTWLEDKPREWSQIIALRCALRVVPIIAENSWKYKSSDQKNLVLAIFRALAITSCSIQFQNNKMIKQEAAIVAFSAAAAADTADAAAQFSTDVNAAYVAYCAADAAFGITAATAIDASSFAYYTASEFPGDFAANVKNDLRLDIKYDVDALANNRLPEKLYCSPIWKSQSQRYVDLHAELKADFTALGDDFSLWSEWYQRRVDGKANAFERFDRDANEEFYRYLVEQDDDWWKREPALVNGDIKALVDSLRKAKAPTDQELVQNPEVVNYVLNDADQAEPAPEPLPNGLTNDRDNRDNHEEIWRLLNKALAASGIGATQATYLTDDLQNFGEALGEEIERLSPRKFVLRADELQRLIDQDQAEGQDNLKPPFSQAQIDALLPMLSAVKMYIEFEPRLAHLRNGPNSVTEPILNKEQAQAIVQATQEGDLVPENDNITQSAVDNISSGAGENDPARRKASEMLVNMIRAFGRRIKSLGEFGNTTERIIRIGQRIGELWDKVRAILPEDSLIAQIIRWIITQGN